MAAVTSRRPVKYRNHCPKPTLSNISTIAGTPASLEPPAAMQASAVRTERVQRMMRRPLPEAAGSSFDIVIRILLRKRCRYLVYLNYLAPFAAKNPTDLFPENGKESA